MYELKDLVLGYRKFKGLTETEMAEELMVPGTVLYGLQMGSYKHPTAKLMLRINNLTEDMDKEELVAIGKGCRLKTKLGPDFKYYLIGLGQKTGLNPNSLRKLPLIDCYKTLGFVEYDDFELTTFGRQLTQ
ncbi:MAG: hypothetical protein Q7U35_04005 [Methanobacteriaceae archaeon]|nr:hypothetical protein [Methanobacteriaceae archaeon]MDP2836560.1 hypothetical protein [Methanobacteriaceae archaeon]MDP3034317.1 hypothetical protein [Methanobacteriaceae archaeon]MDP3485494.1 hypothetical protein [Methanobacteriaceae archaeon]MDP3622377.1 hypothetical protein [Methanobacteriaceae archaeon]